jgi:hypothetical protein
MNSPRVPVLACAAGVNPHRRRAAPNRTRGETDLYLQIEIGYLIIDRWRKIRIDLGTLGIFPRKPVPSCKCVFSMSSSELDGLPYIRSRHHCWARGRSHVGAYFLVPGSTRTKPGVWENCVGFTNLMLEVSTNCRNSERWVQS